MTITSDICRNCDDASPRFCFETKLYIRLLISFINDEGSTGPPTAWSNQTIVAFDRPYPGVIYPKPAMTQVLDFLWGSIQYEDFAFLGLIEMDLWGPLRPGKISGHGLRSTVPGYNICKICDDASLSYFRRIFWKSLFRLFRFSKCRIWGVHPRSLRPAGT